MRSRIRSRRSRWRCGARGSRDRWRPICPCCTTERIAAVSPSRSQRLDAPGASRTARVPGSAERRTAGASQMDFGNSDERYQEEILPHVSRTFALTIPQLPPGLRSAVTNAYLLCRIADTIEDEPAVSPEETFQFLERFAAVVSGAKDPAALACALDGRFSDRTLPAERDLVGNLERIVRVTWGLGAQRAAIERCIALMCRGMHEFQRSASLRGLPRSSDLDGYCYYVAGVVGEMLTELFCAYSPAVAARHDALAELSVSFAQGLQMTNILKDFWRTAAAAPAGFRRRPLPATASCWRSSRPGAPEPASMRVSPSSSAWLTHTCAMRSRTPCSFREPKPASGASASGRSDSPC